MECPRYARSLPQPRLWVRRLCNPLQQVATGWLVPGRIPDLCLLHVNADWGVPIQFLLQDVEDEAHPICIGDNIYIVQECDVPLSGEQSCPDRPESRILTQREHEGQENFSPVHRLDLGQCGGLRHTHLPTNTSKADRRTIARKATLRTLQAWRSEPPA